MNLIGTLVTIFIMSAIIYLQNKGKQDMEGHELNNSMPGQEKINKEGGNDKK